MRKKLKQRRLTKIPNVRGKSLVGKRVEIVPWHKTFRNRSWILRGTLMNIRKGRGVKGLPSAREKKPASYIYVIKPDRDTVYDFEKGQKAIIRLVDGHKIRLSKK